MVKHCCLCTEIHLLRQRHHSVALPLDLCKAHHLDTTKGLAVFALLQQPMDLRWRKRFAVLWLAEVLVKLWANAMEVTVRVWTQEAKIDMERN